MNMIINLALEIDENIEQRRPVWVTCSLCGSIWLTDGMPANSRCTFCGGF